MKTEEMMKTEETMKTEAMMKTGRMKKAIACLLEAMVLSDTLAACGSAPAGQTGGAAAEDGSYIEISDEEDLKQYMVVSQNLEPNTEIKYTFQVDSELSLSAPELVEITPSRINTPLISETISVKMPHR